MDPLAHTLPVDSPPGVEARIPVQTGPGSEDSATGRVVAAVAARGGTVAWARAQASAARGVPGVVVDLRVGPWSTWRFDVDARDGRVLSGRRTSSDALGRVYPTNPFRSDAGLVELPRLASDEALVGANVDVRSCDLADTDGSVLDPLSCDLWSRHAEPDPAGDYVFGAAPASSVDPMAEVGVYVHVDRMSAWMAEEFGLILPYAPIVANVNFPMTNAFFGDFDGDGRPEVSFGTDVATGIDFAYDADVVYHELGHAYVDLLAPDLPFVAADELGLDWAAGSLNEGAADLFSLLLTGDPTTGEYAAAALDRPSLRDLSWQRRCPEDLRGEVHRDGEVVGSFGWTLIEEPAVGRDRVAELLVGALSRLGPRPDWPTIGAAFRSSAEAMHAAGRLDEDALYVVLERLRDSGMEGCERVVPLDDGAAVDLVLLAGGLQGELDRLPGGAQLSLDVPGDATAVRLTLSGFSGDVTTGWALYGRLGRPVGHTAAGVDALGLAFAYPSRFDWSTSGTTPGAELWLREGDGRFVAGERLYLSVASDGLPGAPMFDFRSDRLVVAAEVVRDEDRAPGCDTGRGSGGRAWWWSALLAAGVGPCSRRRPRRPSPQDEDREHRHHR